MDILTALKTITKSIKDWADTKFFNKNNIDSTLNANSINPVQNRVINTEITNIKRMIGDIDVSAQINSALKSVKASDFGIYVQATEPVDAPDGAIWIDTESNPTEIDGDVPDTLPNPYTLTFSGAVSGSYDGSSAVNISIPDASSVVSSHNTNTSAHNDIRIELQALSNKINAFLDSDDTTLDELSELIVAIQNNKTTIEQLTSGKINTSDIINNLTTNVSTKPLSAAQGVVLKTAIDSIRSLPSVTTADNGKVLMVVNGAWSVVDLNMTIDSNGVVSI